MRRRKWDEDGFEKWGGYMEAKKTKLEEQFNLDSAKHSDASGTSGIFRNIAIFVNGYTIPTADELKQLMIKHGGIYHLYYRSEKTSHVIASNLPDSKIKQLKGMKVVKPEWIVESIAKGKLLDYRLYLLYTNQSKTQPKLFLNSNLQKACTNLELATTSNKKENNEESFLNSCSKSTALSKSDESRKECNSEIEAKDAIGCKDANIALGLNKNLRQHVVKTASETSFLSEFYSNSRLHHISTMGAIFKQYVSNLRSNDSGEFKGIIDFKDWLSKNAKSEQMEGFNDYQLSSIENKKIRSLIMHIDMDCFFVSVGLRKRPDLKGCPVAVTHAKANSQATKRDGMDRSLEFNLYKERAVEKLKSTKTKIEHNDHKQPEQNPWSDWVEAITDTNSMSEIASCNYEARKAGLKNGMFLGQALKMCPNLKTIPYDFEAYKEVSYTLYNTVASFTLDIEAVSCDEMFVDCTELLKNTCADPMQLASFLRQEIKVRTECTCSTGFGSNRLQARLATKRAKPDGQYYIAPEEVMEFMKSVKVSDIPGVGRATSYKLSQLDINTCSDLQKMSLSKLQAEFGKKMGDTLFKNCRGEDDRMLTFNQERKSVSAEVNYGIRFESQTDADAFFKQLTMEVCSRLQEVRKSTRCITLKLMIRAKDAPEESAKFLGHGVCDYTTKSSTLAIATADSTVILREVLSLCKQLNVNPKELRGIGIQLSRLDDMNKSTKMCKDSIDKFLVPKNGKSSGIKKQENNIQNVKIIDDCNSTAYQKSININTFFKQKKPLKETKIKCKQSKHVNRETLDISVLKALPEDIKKEVLKEYGLSESDVFTLENEDEVKLSKFEEFSESCSFPVTQKNENVPDSKLLVRKQIILEPVEDNNTSLQFTNLEVKGPLTTDLSLAEIRTLIREWVNSEDSPQDCDVIMLKDYLQQLVVLRQLENLEIALNCLYRCIANKNNEEWQSTYFCIVNKVQDTMLTIYGAELFVQNKF